MSGASTQAPKASPNLVSTFASSNVRDHSHPLQIFRPKHFSYTHYTLNSGQPKSQTARSIHHQVQRFETEKEALLWLSSRLERQTRKLSEQSSANKVMEIHWVQEMAHLFGKAEGWRQELDGIGALLDRAREKDHFRRRRPLGQQPEAIIVEGEALVSWILENGA